MSWEQALSSARFLAQYTPLGVRLVVRGQRWPDGWRYQVYSRD